MDFGAWAASGCLFSDEEVRQKFEEWYGGGDAVSSLATALRHPPSQTTLRVTRDVEQLPEVLDVVRASVAGRGVAVHPVIDTCIVVSPLDATPLERQVQSVVVDSRCGEAVLRGADIFAPGVLASSGRFEKGTVVNILVPVSAEITPLKGSIVDRDQCTPESKTLILIGVGEAVLPRQDIVKQGQSGVAIRVLQRIVNHPPMDNVCKSAMLQNIPSMLPPLLLNPAEGSRVIDMCAAPGGKTVHLAQLLRNQGEVVALDRSAKRLDELKKLAEAAGATCVVAEKRDSCKAVKHFGPSSFDAVLLDPPCSGLGLRPKLYHDCSMKQLTEFASYQRRLMTAAFQLAKPGALISYSTCTISPLENEGNVAWFLEEYRDCVTLEAPDDRTRKYYELAQPGLPNVGLPADILPHVIRFTPTDSASPYTGFFVALFRKLSEKKPAS
eukprot:TRINITY_DN9838_c0_g2_i1.p1 TRINITY_DN9838_c0_g2~~TRINITY_DN9838_c0_g2_i1.p1  ORF type:complete len:440 (+),score=135.29 TRINITY_DN9838_c0_g2_i1:73-1392(+)